MNPARMRARYLAAMGLAAAACAKEHAPTADSATATATATATVTATATATEPTPHHLPMRPPMCPTGNFCVAQPHHVAADAGAPQPYAMCAASAAAPMDAGTIFGTMHPYVTFDEERTKDTRATDPKACCYTWVIPCPGGRALRGEDGVGIVAAERERADWIDATVIAASFGEGEARAAAAERWAREAAFEHASIAAFARVTLDLLALGAPAELVAGAQRAALDEVEHARVAYALASALAGRAMGPGPLPVAERAAATLESVVREAVAEGCVGEALAAFRLREEAARSPAAYARTLERIAEDEERHAALAYATVAWAASVDAETTARVVGDELAHAGHEAQLDPARARVLREIAAPCLGALISATTRPRRS